MENIIASVIQEVGRVTAAKGAALIAIDGRCAAGKSTLAARLGEALGCPVLHMDSFFLRPEQRTARRLAEPGGNVDRERFLAEVLRPLSRGERFSYRPYDCGVQRLAEPVAVAGGSVALVEGSYACHPELWGYYDLHVFMDVSPEEQLRRILRRDGPERLDAFRGRWIPLEERYFAAFHIPERCELCYGT